MHFMDYMSYFLAARFLFSVRNKCFFFSLAASKMYYHNCSSQKNVVSKKYEVMLIVADENILVSCYHNCTQFWNPALCVGQYICYIYIYSILIDKCLILINIWHIFPLIGMVQCILDAVVSSGILKAKQKLGVTFNFDKHDVIDFTKFSKMTMCRASEANS